MRHRTLRRLFERSLRQLQAVPSASTAQPCGAPAPGADSDEAVAQRAAAAALVAAVGGPSPLAERIFVFEGRRWQGGVAS